MKLFAVDLFAGTGGLSEGFTSAGFHTLAYVEKDSWACETLRTRSMYHWLKERGALKYYYDYVKGVLSKESIYQMFPGLKKELDAEVIEREMEEDSFDNIVCGIKKSMKYHDAHKVDVLLGGPPCQPYSRMGRVHDKHKIDNHQHFLFKFYLKLLEKLRPLVFVFENVPEMLSPYGNGFSIIERFKTDFKALQPAYAVCPPEPALTNSNYMDGNFREYVFNALSLGVPQARKRFFLIGYKKSFWKRESDVMNLFLKIKRNCRDNRITVGEAIGDLPPLKPGEGSDSYLAKYTGNGQPAAYAMSLMDKQCGVVNHRARSNDVSPKGDGKDLERYRFFIKFRMERGKNATLKDLLNEKPDLMPNHRKRDIFIDRYKVQWKDSPATTITAHINRDGHYYIHYDIKQCRSFTVREAARCQSFPDNYFFEGPRTEQFRQVGNAVPPAMARRIARTIKTIFERHGEA